ncbi:hypothetical protein SLS62_009941 [Diatrype stigma]|uniref:Uncharacterized protein n=1 Tax=Diatrype stigma TaxID=117547 RepID=A0AAN9YJI4_9PEZI
MPIIIHTDPAKVLLKEMPFETDKNRKLLENAPSERRELGKGVCAFIPERNLVSKGVDFEIQPTVQTLDKKIRERISDGIRKKKQALCDAYDVLRSGLSGLPLDSMPWPNVHDKDFTNLISKFKDLQCPAVGTGLHIGNKLVITAAHMVTNDNRRKTYRLVFDFNGDKKILGTNVFRIKKIVHLFRGSHGSPQNPAPSESVPPFLDRQLVLAEEIKNSLTYDVAIVKIKRISTDKSLPRALVLQPSPAIMKTKVFSIGCSHGLPLIYADGSAGETADPKAATVRRIPDAHNYPSPEEQGTITADIDVFKGNSGGPLFEASGNNVIGICRSGLVTPWLGDLEGEEATNIKLKKAVKTWIEAHKRLTDKRTFEWDYLDFYLELRMLHDNSRVSWLRCQSNSISVVGTNAFSRTDPYAYLTMPLHSFVHELRGQISIEIEITPSAPFTTPGSVLRGDLALRITSRRSQGNPNEHRGSTLMLPAGWANDRGQGIKWVYPPALADIVPTPDAPVCAVGALPETLLPLAGGVCSWKSLVLNRVSNAAGGYVAGEMQPLGGLITVRLTPPDAATFLFRLELGSFTRVTNDNDSWTTPLGKSLDSVDRGMPVWNGPL